MLLRKSGILMHLSSLPSPYGIGSMGRCALDFADFLADAGQSFWQVLPICPTSYGDSPYQSFSTFAGNPYFIDLEALEQDGLLQREEYAQVDWESAPGDVNYGALYEKRYPILRLAAQRLLAAPPADYTAFLTENRTWLPDYAAFMALKDAHGGRPWWEWEEGLRLRHAEDLAAAQRTYASDISFWQALQYLFFRQWKALKHYVNEKGISLIGDLPIYVSLDSADVWARPELFQLGEDHMPTEVAGCPPDAFAADGQLWGNPLFDWDAMARDGYAWWTERIQRLCQCFEVLRIDHFRGFEAYYAIPYGAPDAREGRWKKGPGAALFQALERTVGPGRIIAEDLGFLTVEVHALRQACGFPGMRVLEFAFDPDRNSTNPYLPHNLPRHCVAYSGTHDNDTLRGWLSSLEGESACYAQEYLRLSSQEPHWDAIAALWQSVADLTIVQAQDLLGLGSEARMNTPSTVGTNWRWRSLPGAFTPALSRRLRDLTALYGRLG